MKVAIHIGVLIAVFIGGDIILNHGRETHRIQLAIQKTLNQIVD